MPDARCPISASENPKLKIKNFRLKFSVSSAAALTLLATLLLLQTGCATAPSYTPPPPPTGDPLIDGRAQINSVAPRDRALYAMRLALTTLRKNDLDTARALFDDALGLSTAAITGPNKDAAKSRRLFRQEANKPFVGEPYERIMLHVYRALLYWRDGEPDNARALLRSAALIDSDTADKTYAADYVLLDYLDYLATAKLSGDNAEALARARQHLRKLPASALPAYSADANTFIFVEFGEGPDKYPGGEYGELLRFSPGTSPIHSAHLEINGQTISLPALDDLNFQATTRGGRLMDQVLQNKANFKQGADTFGDAALVGAVVTANNGHSRKSQDTALALAAVGLISKIASASTKTNADTRAWDNLPGALSFAYLRLPPGPHPATLTFYDERDRLLPGYTQTFTIEVAAPPAGITTQAAPDTVIFRSTHKR